MATNFKRLSWSFIWNLQSIVLYYLHQPKYQIASWFNETSCLCHRKSDLDNNFHYLIKFNGPLFHMRTCVLIIYDRFNSLTVKTCICVELKFLRCFLALCPCLAIASGQTYCVKACIDYPYTQPCQIPRPSSVATLWVFL